MQSSLAMAREDARQRSQCVALSWGVMHFLMKCEEKGIARDRRRLSAEHPISRSLLAPIFKDREFTPGGHGIILLKGTLMEQLASARELQKRNVTLGSLGLRQRDLPNACSYTLKSLGVIRRHHRNAHRDWIGESLQSLYGCSSSKTWRVLLGTEYEHALQFLVEAKARFPGAYSDWLGLQDSFADIVIRQYFGFLQNKGLPGYSKTRDKNGKMVKYGSLIAKNSPLDNACPVIASNLREVHQRRNTLPGSHPYDEKGGAKNKWLTKKERDRLVPKIKKVFDEVAKIVEQNK